MNSKITLKNIQDSEQKNKPDKEKLAAVAKGDYVQLVFVLKDKSAGERMWVIVNNITTTKSKGRQYSGTVNQNPALLGDWIKDGDKIKFTDCNILLTQQDLNERMKGPLPTGNLRLVHENCG